MVLLLPLNIIYNFMFLFQSLLSLMSVEDTTERLISILCEAATPKDPTTYKTGFWGRAQVNNTYIPIVYSILKYT